MNEKQTDIIWRDRKHHLWFPWSFTQYYIERERLMIKKGLFNTTLDESLLYRVVDITLKQSLWGKIFGTGNLIVNIMVDNSSEIILQNIAKPYETRSLLSDLVEQSRKGRKVVGKEFYGNNGHQHVDINGDGECDLEL